MPSASANLVEVLEQTGMLAGSALAEVKKVLLPRLPDARALAQELVRRGWLTAFQARQILRGRGRELVIGSYMLLEPLGKGGTGQVYKARHLRMDRTVALKALRPDLVDDKEVVDRFFREIEVASRLSHPHLVHAYEAGPIRSILVLIMEYVDGPNLEELVEKSGPVAVGLACEYMRQAAIGLQYAHEQGLIHRDIKPSNLLVAATDNGGMIKILDLGLARLQEPIAGSRTAHLTLASGSQVMQGTPDYMAPEQAIDFHNADIRSDIYSLGCTLFFLLSGRPPFPGGTLAEKLMRHHQTEPPLNDLGKLPRGLDRILGKMLAKNPEQRFQTPADLVNDVVPFCKSESPSFSGSDTVVPSSKSTLFSSLRMPTLNVKLNTLTQRLPGREDLRNKKKYLFAGMAGLAGLLLVVLLLNLILGGGGPPGPETKSVSAVPFTGPTIVTSYQADFQGPRPKAGWRYLWNQKGPIGNPANYVPLPWNGADYDVDGKPGLPGPSPGSYVYLGKTGGHPGRGSKQAAGKEYYAIAAYTIQPTDGGGAYRIIHSALTRGNGLEVIVHVNGKPAFLQQKVAKAPNPFATFDTDLGVLQSGDTVYVAVGPDQSDGSDGFGWSFDVIRAGPPGASPSKTVLLWEDFETSLLPWGTSGQAEFKLDSQSPYQGSKAFRIVVAKGAPLQYQKGRRIVDAKATPGQRYRASVWFRTKDVAGNTGAYAYLEFLNNDRRLSVAVSKRGASAVWKKLTMEATAPALTNRVRFCMTLHAHGTAWFDRAEVVREK